MAYANEARTQISFAARLGEIAALIKEHRRARRVYRETLAELSALNARELMDLGIDRTMIRSIATEAAYGPAASRNL